MAQLGFPDGPKACAPTSFPTFFHQDQAYEKILTLDSGVSLSEDWTRRVQCWKALLQWWLLGKLTEQIRAIPQALERFVPQRDGRPAVTTVTWLLRTDAPGVTQPVGLLSPVVLVRPAPASNLRAEFWNTQLRVAEKQECQRRLARLALDVQAAERNSPNFRPVRVLVDIVRKQFPGLDAQSARPGTPTSFPILDYRSLETAPIVLQLREGRRLFVPTCDQCQSAILPVEASVAPLQESLELSCPSCGAAVTLPLTALFCGWDRYATPELQLVAWANRPPQWAEAAVPDPPEVQETESGLAYIFEEHASAALLGRPAQDRTLLVRLSGHHPSVRRVQDVMFTRPELPTLADSDNDLAALPLRPQYAGLWNGFIRRDNAAVAIGLVGLPQPVLVHVSAARTPVAMWPDPRRTPPNWRRFELLTDDTHTVRADNTSGRRITTRGRPAFVGVHSRGESAGCTLALQEAIPSAPPTRFRIAVDFGTTSSVVYSRILGGGTPEDNPYRPDEWRTRGVRWLGQTDDQTKARLLDHAFPATAQSDAVGALVPSEFCTDHGYACVSVVPCCGKFEAFFKNAPTAGVLREEYLAELIFAAVGRELTSLHGCPSELSLEAVFTYPLTFTYRDVERFKSELQHLSQRLEHDLGLSGRPEFSLLDEPSAGVLSVGAPAAHEWVLIADLGGGTLDVSFGKGLGAAAVGRQGEEPDWIGSLDIGGRYFLGAVAPDAKLLQAGIRARDERTLRLFDTERTQVALQNYMGLLCLYLGLLAVARLRSEEPGTQGSEVRIQLFPLGNGWRLLDLTDTPHIGPEQLFANRMDDFRQQLERFIQRALGRPVQIVLQPAGVARKWHPKHAVAQGAISASAQPQRASARLPIGVDLAIGDSRLPWWDAIGPAVRGWNGLVLNDSVTFDFTGLMSTIDHFRAAARPLPLADAAAEAPQIRRDLTRPDNAVPDVVRPNGYYRGPLQILMEQVWRDGVVQ